MDVLAEFIVIIAIVVALCIFSYKVNLMTAGACVVSFFMATAIGAAAGIWWTLAFFTFPAIAFASTKIGFKKKSEEGLQEGKRGERSTLNILGVGTIPTVIALAYFFTDGAGFEQTVAFVSALAVSCSDTVASEIGVRDKRVYMITTLKPCEVGLNGGISRFGMFVSAASALLFSFVAFSLVMQDLDVRFLIPAFAGIMGNIFDSLFGALFENKGRMSKYTVNCSTSLIGATIGCVIAFLI
ncbi:putative membrane protein [Thermoplasmatales archaeon BRNA1]|nr:putative membrane protein [Thermoplasmatales archaeon BRNA1]